MMGECPGGGFDNGGQHVYTTQQLLEAKKKNRSETMTTGKEIIVRMFAVAVAMSAAVSHADTVAW